MRLNLKHQHTAKYVICEDGSRIQHKLPTVLHQYNKAHKYQSQDEQAKQNDKLM